MNDLTKEELCDIIYRKLAGALGEAIRENFEQFGEFYPSDIVPLLEKKFSELIIFMLSVESCERSKVNIND